MLVANKDLSIEISHGDLFDVPFNIKGLEIKKDANIYFAVKKFLEDKEPVVLKQCSHIDYETNSVRIVIESDQMATLKPGKYYYELFYKVGDNRRTLNYPARLVVCEVVHNEWN